MASPLIPLQRAVHVQTYKSLTSSCVALIPSGIFLKPIAMASRELNILERAFEWTIYGSQYLSTFRKKKIQITTRVLIFNDSVLVSLCIRSCGNLTSTVFKSRCKWRHPFLKTSSYLYKAVMRSCHHSIFKGTVCFLYHFFSVACNETLSSLVKCRISSMFGKRGVY